MNKLFSRWLPCATLATWSAILIYIFCSGRITAFLAPGFRPYVLVAGVLLGIMAAIFLFAPVDAECCVDATCGHSLFRLPLGKLLTFLVLLLPITLSAMASRDAFGRTMMENRGIDTDGSSLGKRKSDPPPPRAQPSTTAGTATTPGNPATAKTATTAPVEEVSDYLQRTPEGYIIAEVLDLLYAAQDNDLRKDFEGKKIELIGQLMPDKSVVGKAPTRFKAVRMFMSCCAADARPVATLVETAQIPDLPEMTWVKVTGVSTFPLENGRRIAVIKAEKVEKTSPPGETMLY